MSPPLNTPGEHFDRLCDYLFASKKHEELSEVLTDLLNWLGVIFSLNDEGVGVVRAMLRDGYRSAGRCHANLSPMSPLLTTSGDHFDRLCDFLLNEKRYKELSGLLKDLLPWFETIFSPNDKGVGVLRVKLGDICSSEGNPRKAIKQFEDALAVFEKMDDDGWIAGVLMSIGGEELTTREYSAAENTLRRALNVVQKVFPDEKKRLATIKQSLGNALQGLGRDTEGISMFESALELYHLEGLTEEVIDCENDLRTMRNRKLVNEDVFMA